MAYLKLGQKVALVAPGGWVSTSIIKKSLRLLESWGLQPYYRASLQRDGYFSAPLLFRQKSLMLALKDRDTQAIFCLRGGYGTSCVVEALRDLHISRKKIIVGMSDITSLHSFLNRKGWTTLHAPVLSRLVEQPKEALEVKQILFGEKPECVFKVSWLYRPQRLAIEPGKIVGGNLRVLESGVGTFWEVKAKNKFLFLEDINEKGYQVHRALVHLRQAGVLDGVRALILGDFTGGDRLVWPFIKEFVCEEKIPAFRGLKVGHGQLQKCLPLNTKAELSRQTLCVSCCHSPR